MFLSFSLVFCLLGSRFEASLYIHFTRRWVKSTRHSSARRKNKNEKSGEGAPFFAVLCVEFVSRPVQLTTSASHTYWTSPPAQGIHRLSDDGYGDPPRSVPGVGGATTPFTTSTAPISAKRSSLRRVRSRVRRRSPTLLCMHRYSAMASINLSIKRGEVCGPGGGTRHVSSL